MVRRGLWLQILIAVVSSFSGLLHAQATPPPATTAPMTPPPAADALQATPQAPPPLSPGAIYRDATHPLDVVRGSLDNWSDAELSALNVGIRRAREACAQANAESFTGDDLYDLARLCSFGQDWNDANTAASRYLDSRAEPHRAQAYALSMNALVKMNGVDVAIQTARQMLRTLPYDSEVAFAIRFMKDYLEQSGNPEAVKLAAQEHPAIVQAISAGGPLKATWGDAVMTVGALYQSAMQLAFLDRYTGDDAGASTAVSDLESSLSAGTGLGPEDKKLIAAVRAQYRLLGQHVPDVKVVRSLQSPTAKAKIDANYGAATVLVLFPGWCPQCRRMMRTLTEFARVNKGMPIHALGLMFEEESDSSPQGSHEDVNRELLGTATLLVPPDTAQLFAAIDYPLGIVLDAKGIIRFLGVLPSDAFNGNGYINKVIERMAGTSVAAPATGARN